MQKQYNSSQADWSLFNEDAEDMLKPSYFKKRDRRRDRSASHEAHYRPYETTKWALEDYYNSSKQPRSTR